MHELGSNRWNGTPATRQQSENQPQRHLNLTGRRSCGHQPRTTWNNLPLCRKRRKRLTTGPAVREVRVIEQIERLHSELRLQFLAQQIVVFEKREIEVVLYRS